MALPVLIILLLPVAAFSLGLFDLGNSQDLMGGESGYSHWLLRMPIANWKLATVPIVLRTLWIGLGWYLFTLTTRQLSGIALPVWSLAAVFSAMGAWASVITWRPFRSGRWRVAMTLTTGILLFALMTLLLNVHFEPGKKPLLSSPAGQATC